jgi:hypothetical protein
MIILFDEIYAGWSKLSVKTGEILVVLSTSVTPRILSNRLKLSMSWG